MENPRSHFIEYLYAVLKSLIFIQTVGPCSMKPAARSGTDVLIPAAMYFGDPG